MKDIYNAIYNNTKETTPIKAETFRQTLCDVAYAVRWRMPKIAKKLGATNTKRVLEELALLEADAFYHGTLFTSDHPFYKVLVETGALPLLKEIPDWSIELLRENEEDVRHGYSQREASLNAGHKAMALAILRLPPDDEEKMSPRQRKALEEHKATDDKWIETLKELVFG